MSENNNAVAVRSASAGELLLNGPSMERLERIADLMVSGKTTVPQHLRGSKGDCFAIILQSMQWGMNPFAVAQKTFLVNGTLGYESQLVSAVVNTSGAVKDRFHFEWFGDWEKIVGKFKEIESREKKDDSGRPKKFIVPDWQQSDERGLGVSVWATLKGETEPRVLKLLMTQARTRNSTLWTEDPKQQIAYLAQKRWARLYCPDVLLGVYTPDELEQPVERFMGDIEEVKPVKAEPVFLSEEKFEKDFDNLADRLRKRLKTVDSMAQYFITRGTPLTDKQIDRLNAVKPNEKEAEPTLRDTATDVVEKPAKSVDHVVPAFTYAQVADAMHAANTHAELEAAAEAIGGFVAPQDRSDLTAIYNERTGKVAPF